LKQTNFIERLVEDTLATNEAEAPITFHEQQQHHQDIRHQVEEPAEIQSETESTFSRLNESLDDRRSLASTIDESTKAPL
jgi:hypothetical protein